MNLRETIRALRAAGVRTLTADLGSNAIRFEAPPGAVSPELRTALTEHKAALLDLARARVVRAVPRPKRNITQETRSDTWSYDDRPPDPTEPPSEADLAALAAHERSLVRAYVNSEMPQDYERALQLCAKFGLDYATMRAVIAEEMRAAACDLAAAPADAT